jgi:catechol 2,3-dioxygenase-like lactoylglutathione lyase family enzyme
MWHAHVECSRVQKGRTMLGKYDLLTTIPARDLERAKAFYEQKLGLTPFFEDPGALHYRCGSTYLDLYPTQSAGEAQHTLACWMVDDLERVVAELRERGVAFEEYDFPGLKTVNGIAELPTERSAWFKDSEGNILAVAQLTANFRDRT